MKYEVFRQRQTSFLSGGTLSQMCPSPNHHPSMFVETLWSVMHGKEEKDDT